MTATTTTRKQRIEEVLEEITPVGDAEDTGIAHLLTNPERFLLVEENNGSAAYMQSHYLTTHESLEYAGAYNVGQEFAEDWSILFALDLDTGVRHEPEVRIEWEPHESLMLEADHDGKTWMVHGFCFDATTGEPDRTKVTLKRSPDDRRRTSYDWLSEVPVGDLTNIKWSAVA